MKLTTISTVLILLATSPVFGKSKPPSSGFQLLNSSERDQKDFQEAQERAIRYLDAALPHLKGPFVQNLGRLVREKLRVARILVSTNAESEKQCGSTGEYLTHIDFKDNIYLCQVVRDKMKNNRKEYIDIAAQLFIHEAVHLVYFDHPPKDGPKREECNPTEFELAIMNNSGVGIKSTANLEKYYSQCSSQLAHYVGLMKNSTASAKQRPGSVTKHNHSAR